MKPPPPSRPRRKTGEAARFGSARQFPWMKEEDALLGKLSDREVARFMNRSVGKVRCKRIELAIPIRIPRYEVWTPNALALLGKLPEKEAARAARATL